METIRPVVIGVDNSSSMKKVLKKGTENLDIDLTVFTSAGEAWTYLQSNTPDLIILSIILPIQDGLSLLRDIRKQPRHKQTPVIIVSSKDYTQDRILAEELGALEFIPKPMPIKTITDIVVKYTNASFKRQT